MLTATDTIIGQDVVADEAHSSHSHVCRECGCRATLKRGEIRIPHFAHARGTSCPAAAESIQHTLAKYNLYRLLKNSGWVPELEKRFVFSDGGIRRADIYAEKRKSPVRISRVVIEVQNSSISPEEVEARNRHYNSRHIKTLWVPTLNHNLDFYNSRSDEYSWRYVNAIKREVGLILPYTTDVFRIQGWQRYLIENNNFQGLAWLTRARTLCQVRFKPRHNRVSQVEAFFDPIDASRDGIELSFSPFEESRFDEYLYDHGYQEAARMPVFSINTHKGLVAPDRGWIPIAA